MYSHFPAVCMLISQRKTRNFPPLLKDTLETRNTQIIYLKTQFSTVSSRWSGQSQMTWKVSRGCWLFMPVSSKYCLTPGCLNLRLVQEEECARLCTRTHACVFLHAYQKGYLKASGALKSYLRVCATLILASSLKGE